MNSFSHKVLQFPAPPVAPACREPEVKFSRMACTAIIVGGALSAWVLLAAFCAAYL